MGGLRTVALCVGGAPTVWSELEEAKALVGGRAHVVIVTNHAGRFYEGDIDAWATLHPESFEPWRDERAAKRLNTDYRSLVYYGRKVVPETETFRQRWNGSSGLFAAQLAFDPMGCVGAILCGVPMDQEAGHFHDPGPWTRTDLYRPAFIAAKDDGAEIRSMSGWSADLFGKPDAAWLESLDLGRQPARKRHRQPPEATMRIKMLRTRNYTPAEERRITVKYVRNEEYTVKREWGAAMVKDGDATEVRAPGKPEKANDDEPA